MPRKSKDELKELNNETNSNDVTVEVAAKKTTSSKTAKAKENVKAADKGVSVKKASKKGNSDIKGTDNASKKDTSKSLATATKKKSEKAKKTKEAKDSSASKSKANSAKKASTKASTKATGKSATKSTSKAKKVSKETSRKSTSNGSTKTTKKSTSTRKSTKKTKAESNSKAIVSHVEYYDLPYRYNETTVKILAQTPTTLFIYWDISANDRKSFTEKYGEDFFNNTKPVLVVTNKTMNYSFEIDINDFANCWYLHVNDADCDYSVELGRRPRIVNANIDNYIYVSTSNDMEMPNNHILFDRLGKTVFFRNVKNNFVEEKQISSISFIKSIGKIYDIYEIYQELYKDKISLEELDNMRLNLSSSGGSSSFM